MVKGYKDNVLLLKAIHELTGRLYKENTSNICNYITKYGNYNSTFGQFYKRRNKSKTFEDVITDNQDKIKKLNEELAELKTLDKNTILKEETIVLNSRLSEEAKEEAKVLLKDVIDNIKNKTINNKYAKL